MSRLCKFNIVLLAILIGFWSAQAVPSKYNSTQIRLSRQAYSIAKDEIKKSYSYYNNKSRIYRSYVKQLDPYMLLAIPCVEWGGSASYQTIVTPVINTFVLGSNVDTKKLNLEDVDSYFYLATNVDDRLYNKKYKGPLQIDKNSVKYIDQLSFTGEKDKPRDPYKWGDACGYILSKHLYYISKAYNKAYEFDNKYEVLAHTSIMLNTGTGYITEGSEFGSKNSAVTFPWKNSTAIFKYCRDLSKPENIKIINEYADKSVKDREDAVVNGRRPSNIQLTRGEALKIFNELDLNVGDYIKKEHISTFKSGSKFSVQEKVLHPIQVIWSYQQLQTVYQRMGVH